MAGTSADSLRDLIEKDRPRAYDIDNPAEIKRLQREVWGYLVTCHHKHGTDWAGRQFAIDALAKLWKQPSPPNPPADKRE